MTKYYFIFNRFFFKDFQYKKIWLLFKIYGWIRHLFKGKNIPNIHNKLAMSDVQNFKYILYSQVNYVKLYLKINKKGITLQYV